MKANEGLTKADVESTVSMLRQGFDPTNLSLTLEGLGDCEIIEPTGRATCQICGQKIKNGKQLRGYTANFCGEPWKAKQVSIHLNCG